MTFNEWSVAISFFTISFTISISQISNLYSLPSTIFISVYWQRNEAVPVMRLNSITTFANDEKLFFCLFNIFPRILFVGHYSTKFFRFKQEKTCFLAGFHLNIMWCDLIALKVTSNDFIKLNFSKLSLYKLNKYNFINIILSLFH